MRQFILHIRRYIRNSFIKFTLLASLGMETKFYRHIMVTRVTTHCFQLLLTNFCKKNKNNRWLFSMVKTLTNKLKPDFHFCVIEKEINSKKKHSSSNFFLFFYKKRGNIVLKCKQKEFEKKAKRMSLFNNGLIFCSTSHLPWNF